MTHIYIHNNQEYVLSDNLAHRTSSKRQAHHTKTLNKKTDTPHETKRKVHLTKKILMENTEKYLTISAYHRQF